MKVVIITIVIVVFCLLCFLLKLTDCHLQVDVQSRALVVISWQHRALPCLWASGHRHWEEVVLAPIAPIGQVPFTGQDVLAEGEIQ